MNAITATQAAQWRNLPQVFKTRVLPPPQPLAWLQSIVDRHIAVYGEQLPIEGCDPFCATAGGVRPHIDELEGEAEGKLVYGWIVRSDGHMLHTEDRPEGILLEAGDLYCIHPLVRHWTTAPLLSSQLIFGVQVTPPEARTPRKLAEDYRMTLIVASVEAMRAAQMGEQAERFRFRGIESFDKERTQ